jgi:hypothetical protein
LSFSIFTASQDEAILADTLGAAIATACKIINAGGTVLRIVGSQGLVMEQADVKLECARRGA